MRGRWEVWQGGRVLLRLRRRCGGIEVMGCEEGDIA